MTRQERQKYLDMALAAIEKKGLRFDYQEPDDEWIWGFENRESGILITEPGHGDGLTIYFSCDGYNLDGLMEFMEDCIKFRLDRYMEPFLFIRLPYNNQYKGKLYEFVNLLEQAVMLGKQTDMLEDKCLQFSGGVIEGPYLK